MHLVNTLVCTEPGALIIETRPAPEPAAGQVLVRPRRVGICGTDYHIYEGKHPFLQYPRVMGHELAVEVLSAPSGSSFEAGELCVVNPYLSCGDCIACNAGKPNCCVRISVLGVHQDGGMTGLLALPAGNLVKADGLSADECASVEFLAIGAHAVRRGAPEKGDAVLVVGAGPIGLGVALFARLAGAEVTLVDLDDDRASVVASVAGVGTASASSDGDALHEGFAVVFDATGSRRAMEQSFGYVAYGGRYVMVGIVNDQIAFSDPDFHRRELTLLGSRNATSQDFERVIRAIREGDVAVERLVTHRTSLPDAVTDLPAWAGARSGLIKAMIELD